MTEQDVNPPAPAEGGEAANPTPTEPPAPEQKMLSQDEVNAIIAKEKAKVKAQYEKAEQERQAAAAEEQRIAALKGEEKLNAIHAAEKARMEKELADMQMKLSVATASARLSELGLDPEFAPNLVGTDDEATEANITRFSQMVEAQVTKRLQASLQKGAPPDPEAGGRPNPETAEMAYLRKVAGIQ